MSDGDGRKQLALGGLAAVVVSAALVSWAWWYVSPKEPNISGHQAAQRPERDYEPGGAGCKPAQLNALPADKAPSERTRCAEAREDHRVQQAQLRESVRANDLAEGNLGLTAQQARASVVQTLATVLAFVAAAVAAAFAGLAALHARRSADADNAALKHAREAALGERRPWVSIVATSASVTFGADGVDYVDFTYTLTNVGQNPATAISVSGEGVKEGEPYVLSVANRLIAEDRQMEAEISEMGGGHMGTSLFPGEASTEGQSFSVQRPFSPRFIAGYVAYRSNLTDHTHYTPWAFELYYSRGETGQAVEAEIRKFYLTTPPT